MNKEDVITAEDGTIVTDDMIESWEAAYSEGRLPDGYCLDGPVRRGRPRVFEDGTATVVVRVPIAQKKQLQREASARGLSVSSYVREILSLRSVTV